MCKSKRINAVDADSMLIAQKAWGESPQAFLKNNYQDVTTRPDSTVNTRNTAGFKPLSVPCLQNQFFLSEQ